MHRHAGIRHYPPQDDLAKHLNTDHANLPTIGEVGQAIADAAAERLPETLNTASIGSLDCWGHSFLDMAGNPGPSSHYQIANRLFAALRLSWPHAMNYGAGGTTVTGDWKRMMTTLRPVWDNYGDTSWQSKFGPGFFLYGANDVGKNGHPLFEGGRYLNDWGNAWKGVLAWRRAGAVYAPDWIFGGTGYTGGAGGLDQAVLDSVLDPGGKAGVTYTGTWTFTASDNYACLGPTAAQTTQNGASFAVRLPPRFPGTPVTLFFAGEVGATGTLGATVTHGGTSPASPVALVTNDRVRTPSTYQNVITPVVPVPGLFPVRITGIPPGDGTTSQTITVNAGTLGGGRKLTFLGWVIEATHPSILTVCNIPTARSWAGGLLNTANVSPANAETYVGVGGFTQPLLWPSFPQSNSIQNSSTGPAYGGGIRNGPHAADAWLRDHYNPRIAEVVAEFEPVGSVVIADLGTVLDGVAHPELWSPNDLGGTDHFHPNNLGKGAIAEEALTAMDRVPLSRLHLMAPRLPADSFEAFEFLGAQP